MSAVPQPPQPLLSDDQLRAMHAARAAYAAYAALEPAGADLSTTGQRALARRVVAAVRLVYGALVWAERRWEQEADR